MISLREVRKEFRGSAAVDGLTLDVAAGETLVLLGPSGCGKTTTLRMINRLIEPSSGEIRVDGRATAGTDPVTLRRGIGYLIQDVGLFPHRTIEENILTVPHLLGWDRARCRTRVGELCGIANLDADLLPRRPHELSGGQRQRVGLARALAADPPIILMDEPFGALDPITRQQVRREFRRIASRVRKTTVVVTHDVAEAVELGDRICLMERGRIAQLGTAAELLFRPRSDFVREFFASGRLQTEWLALRLADLSFAAGCTPGLPGETTVADALQQLEQSDEAAFHRVTAAFFTHKRALAAEGGLPA